MFIISKVKFKKKIRLITINMKIINLPKNLTNQYKKIIAKRFLKITLAA